jgi:hypothetical protein
MAMVIRMEAYPDDDHALTSSVYSHDAKRHQLVDELTGKRLEVFVIFTDLPGTLAAIQMAEGLAEQLGAHLRLVMPFEVSYRLPLAEPPVSVDFLEGQMYNLAAETRMEVEAQVCLCRDKRIALGKLLPPNSLIVVGGKKRWWPTAAQLLARTVQRDGHQVIFADLR